MPASDSTKYIAANVALLKNAVDKPLTYLVPPSLVGKVKRGMAVAVPLQKKLVSGVVLDVGRAGDTAILKPIHSLLNDQPVLNETQLQLARWISEEYLSPIGRCCALMVPPGFTPKSAYLYSLAENAKLQPHDDARRRLLDVLRTRGPITESKLTTAMRGVNGWRSTLRNWVKAGAVLKTSTLQPPKVQPQRTTLAQLAIGDATLDVVIEKLEGNRRLQEQTRERRIAALKYLQAHTSLAPAEWIAAETGANRADLHWLADQGYILMGDAARWRDPLADVDYVVKEAPPLTDDQQRAWDRIGEGWNVESGELAASTSTHISPHFLIRGVTGSGKTEVYMRAVERALSLGKCAIVLVPEISLTPQTARRFLERFPGQVALIHSQLKPGERFDTWRRIRNGDLRVVVGARSALFAPVPRLGLIVLDEEHDGSYKQGSPPYYDTRRAAVHYADLTGATLIFGSATPSLEAWHAVARASKLHGAHADDTLQLIELPNRVRGHASRVDAQGLRLGVRPTQRRETDAVVYQPLPEVNVVDMRAELRGGNSSMFSEPLHNALSETLRRGEQAILFLNRRGTASSVLCRDCGLVLRCPNDDVPLTLHIESDQPTGTSTNAQAVLKCHQCDHMERMPSRCPVCGSSRIRHVGIGTQRVEHAINEQFPKARVVRWDRDSSGKTSADVMLQRFINRQADVLVGTQMIAKGLDLPLVTLVGVVLADVGLFLPDFRASERVFNLIEQVAGRAGRGLLPGRVIVQTYNPENPAISFAAKHDVQGFARFELMQRRALNLPPYTRLVRFEVAHEDNEVARTACENLAKQLRLKVSPTSLIGPAQAYFTRRNKRYRWQVIVRTHSPRDLLDGVDVPRECVIDVDPVSVL